MFTGLVECCAPVTAVCADGTGRRLVIHQPSWSEEVAIGDSIAVNGCCLTVVSIDSGDLAFEAGPETLLRTNLGALQPGSNVNLERSLRVGDRLGGHFVTGHVDGLGTLDRRDDEGTWSTCWFCVPPVLTTQMASKGSVAIDGVSLTLVEVDADRFSVMLIPHTLEHTTLGRRKVGDAVNIETDLLAKYAQRIPRDE